MGLNKYSDINFDALADAPVENIGKFLYYVNHKYSPAIEEKENKAVSDYLLQHPYYINNNFSKNDKFFKNLILYPLGTFVFGGKIFIIFQWYNIFEDPVYVNSIKIKLSSINLINVPFQGNEISPTTLRKETAEWLGYFWHIDIDNNYWTDRGLNIRIVAIEEKKPFVGGYWLRLDIDDGLIPKFNAGDHIINYNIKDVSLDGVFGEPNSYSGNFVQLKYLRDLLGTYESAKYHSDPVNALDDLYESYFIDTKTKLDYIQTSNEAFLQLSFKIYDNLWNKNDSNTPSLEYFKDNDIEFASLNPNDYIMDFKGKTTTQFIKSMQENNFTEFVKSFLKNDAEKQYHVLNTISTKSAIQFFDINPKYLTYKKYIGAKGLIDYNLNFMVPKYDKTGMLTKISHYSILNLNTETKVIDKDFWKDNFQAILSHKNIELPILKNDSKEKIFLKAIHGSELKAVVGKSFIDSNTIDIDYFVSEIVKLAKIIYNRSGMLYARNETDLRVGKKLLGLNLSKNLAQNPLPIPLLFYESSTKSLIIKINNQLKWAPSNFMFIELNNFKAFLYYIIKLVFYGYKINIKIDNNELVNFGKLGETTIPRYINIGDSYNDLQSTVGNPSVSGFYPELIYKDSIYVIGAANYESPSVGETLKNLPSQEIYAKLLQLIPMDAESVTEQLSKDGVKEAKLLLYTRDSRELYLQRNLTIVQEFKKNA